MYIVLVQQYVAPRHTWRLDVPYQNKQAEGCYLLKTI